jgi:hypothetical protein
MTAHQVNTIDIIQKAQDYGWLLCIFFSVDIEGATAYKSNVRIQSGSEDWCLIFDQFYEEFPKTFYESYNQTSLNLISPNLWKFVGDEILFYAPLTSPTQTLDHIKAFRQTITRYNINVLQQTGVQCKGTAWIAGFPVRNRIVLLNNNQNNNEQNNSPMIDFIGASIDTGFRLTKFASPRKLVISLDLLWLLAESYSKYPEHEQENYSFLKNGIKYEGKHELKGVFSGKSYPIFWIEPPIKKPVEDHFLPYIKKCAADKIIQFCDETSRTVHPSTFIKPFIVGDDEKLGQIKEDQIIKDFRQQRDALLQLRYKSEEEDMPDENEISTSDEETSGKTAIHRRDLDPPT